MSEGHLEPGMNGRLSQGPMERSSSMHVNGFGTKSEKANEIDEDCQSNGMSLMSKSQGPDKDFEVLS